MIELYFSHALTLNFKLKDINLFKNNHSPNLCANPE